MSVQGRHAANIEQLEDARTPDGSQDPAIREATRSADLTQDTEGGLHHPDSHDTTWLPGEG
eukprot:4960519-Prorocentrum_lima.AAC.1